MGRGEGGNERGGAAGIEDLAEVQTTDTAATAGTPQPCPNEVATRKPRPHTSESGQDDSFAEEVELRAAVQLALDRFKSG